MNLYELTQDLLDLEAHLYEAGGEVDDETMDQYLNTTQAVEEKADNYAALIRHIEGRMQLRKAEIQRMQALYKSDQQAVDRLKDRLLAFMERTGHTKLETRRFRLTAARAGGKQPIVWYSKDPGDYPAVFRQEVVEVKLLNDAVRTALEQGAPLEGPDGPLAALGPRKVSLRIK